MWPYRVANLGPLTYDSGALPTALQRPGCHTENSKSRRQTVQIFKRLLINDEPPHQDLRCFANAALVVPGASSVKYIHSLSKYVI